MRLGEDHEGQNIDSDIDSEPLTLVTREQADLYFINNYLRGVRDTLRLEVAENCLKLLELYVKILFGCWIILKVTFMLLVVFFKEGLI